MSISSKNFGSHNHQPHNYSWPKTLSFGAFSMFLSVALGAFATHGLEATMPERALKTFQTGVNYQITHSLALIFLGLLEVILLLQQKITNSSKTISLHWPKVFFIFGILFFSGNCYLYALSELKIFALLVPVGGTSYLAGWIILGLLLIRES